MKSLMKTSAHQYHNLPFNNKPVGPFQNMNSPICFISESNCITVTVPPKLQLESKCKKQEKAEVSDFEIKDSDM